MGDNYTVIMHNVITEYHSVEADSAESAADAVYMEHGAPRTCHQCPEADGDGWCVVLHDNEEVYSDQYDPSDALRLRAEKAEAERDRLAAVVRDLSELADVLRDPSVRSRIQDVRDGGGVSAACDLAHDLVDRLDRTADISDHTGRGLLNIVFAGEQPDLTFVEAEDVYGRSIRVGRWLRDGDLTILALDSLHPAERDTDAPEAQGGDWYCPECEDYLCAERVNHDETCDTCGSEVEWYVASDTDAPEPRAAEVADG